MRYNRYMKEIEITREILKNLKPQEVLYAEFAEGGAMGACGTARIYTLEDGKLKFYLINGMLDNERTKIYAETNKFLDKLKDKGILEFNYAGFGNYGYKKAGAEFERDDDAKAFVYRESGKKYLIPASCAGVYAHLVAKFAKREVEIEEIRDYLEKNRFKFRGEEACFFDEYMLQLMRTDMGEDWFDMTAMNYYNAVLFLRHLSGEDYILSDYEIAQCMRALYKYRLKYVVEKVGWNKLNKIIVQLVKDERLDLFPAIEKVLGESIDRIYEPLETVKAERASFKMSDADNIELLFNRPALVEFPKAVHSKLLKEIFERPGNMLNPDGRMVAYYFANYLLNEDKLSLADALPAVMHVIEVMPDDDFNQTHTDELYWLCGQIVDQAWRYLEEDEEVQKKYRQVVYEIYWPRVGSLWPILNRDKFEFKKEATAKIMDDAVSFAMSVDEITELNPEVKAFLDAHANQIGYKAGALGRRAFTYTLRGLSEEAEFERILEVIEPDDYDSFLSYPKTIESADLLLQELFRTDNGARITGHARMAVLEALVLRPNTIGVGEHVLGYLDKNFDQMVSIVSSEVIRLGVEPEPALTDLFVAMSKGVTEENEFPALKSIKEKLLKLGCDALTLTNAEKYARRHRRTILFQRSALQKFF